MLREPPESLKALQLREGQLGKLNWGRGRLQPYESFSSLSAKFCALNCIKPLQFRKFLCVVFGSPDWSPYGLSKGQKVLLASILDEPIEIVNTIQPDDFSLCFPSEVFSIYTDNRFNFHYVTYCPECLRRCYHAFFHELSWLKKCLIHQVDLVQVRKDYASGSRHDSYINLLSNSFREANPRWLRLSEENSIWPNGEVAVFTEIRSWMSRAIRCVTDFELGNPHVLGGTSYELRHLGVLLGRLNWLSPLSIEAESCLATEPSSISAKCITLDETLSAELHNVLSKVALSDLVWFYKRFLLLNGDDNSIQTSVKVEIDAIQARHGKCNCEWGWSRYSGWTRVPQDIWPSGIYLCPFALAQEKLKSEWTDVFSREVGDRGEQAWWSYVNIANRYIDLGIVTAQFSFSFSSPLTPCVNWCLDHRVTEIFHDLVLRDLSLRSAEIANWLDTMDYRNPPPDMAVPPASVIVFGEDRRLAILEWPPTYRVPDSLGSCQNEPIGQ